MIRLINKAERGLGLPGLRFPAISLEKNGGEEVITDEHFDELSANKTVASWIAAGFVLIQKIGEPKSKPGTEKDVEKDDLRPAQVKTVNTGNGWWHVYVNDEKVTDKAVRKAAAKKIAAGYD